MAKMVDTSDLGLDADVVSALRQSWKRVPGFSLYEVNRLGEVRLNNTDIDERRFINQSNSITTKGSYKVVSIKNDRDMHVTVLVHCLVCPAFNGEPPADGRRYEVNHKDGNKHNNRPENLEWVTRSENLHHAYKTGLRNDKVRLLVTDHVEGEVISYYSIGEFSRAFGLDHKTAVRVVDRFRVKRYLDRYTFERDFSEFKASNHAFVKELMAYDYTNRRLIKGNTSAVLEYATGIKRATILSAVRAGDGRLVGGFVFHYLDVDYKFPEYTDDEVYESRECYFNKKEPVEKRYGVRVKDYTTDTIKEYDTIKDVSDDTGLSSAGIRNILSEKSDRLVKGMVFRHLDDYTPFPEFDKEYVEVNLRLKKPEYPIIEVKDLQLNTTKLYASISEFAELNGLCSVTVSKHLRQKGCEPYKGRYVINRVTQTKVHPASNSGEC